MVHFVGMNSKCITGNGGGGIMHDAITIGDLET